jgi:hypothetical protein
MSDSGGFLDNLKSKLNDAIAKIKEIAGGLTNNTTSDADTSDAPPTPKAATEPSVTDSIIYYLTIAIRIIIPILFATIISNEMIIYRPSVRVFYFVLTWILCLIFTSFRVIIFIYYLLRWIFNKYKKSEGSSGGFFPILYTFIPWSTNYETFRPFRYLTIDIGDTPLEKVFEDKSFQKKLKNAYYLGEKMVEYFNVLESANPYRGYPGYKMNIANVTKTLFEMHMPALKIDHIKKEYIVRLHREGDNDEFIKIPEHSITSDLKQEIEPIESAVPTVKYDKQTKSFKLALPNGTKMESSAPMPPTL